MIYGLNFNSTPIPEEPSKIFPRRLKYRNGNLVKVSENQGCDYILQGVCETPQELSLMRIQANNGRRSIHVTTMKSGWYGVYCD